jgi:hypothetical protein
MRSDARVAVRPSEFDPSLYHKMYGDRYNGECQSGTVIRHGPIIFLSGKTDLRHGHSHPQMTSTITSFDGFGPLSAHLIPSCMTLSQ